MIPRGRRIWLPGAAALCLVLTIFTLNAIAQTLSDEELELLKALSPEERAALLESYGVAPADEVAGERDVSVPDVMAPRELEVSDVERAMSGGRAGEDVEASDDVTDVPLGPAEGEEEELRRAFRSFVEESLPLEIDTDIRQFGYELFAGAPTTFAPATDIPVSADYIIGPGDEVRVQLYGKTNRGADLVVDRDGVLNFPELGPMTVAGLTFREMKETVAREVDNRMIGVDVSVSMGRLRSIRVFVLGEVFQPGSYMVSGLSNLTNALFASGGVKKIGSLRRVQLKRDGVVVQEMDLYDLLLKGDTSADVRLVPGDVIFVPPVGPLAGVAGEVLRPAIYELKGDITARQLIELAGGLRATAHSELIQLERVENGGRITYDMSLAGAGQWTVRDGDLLKVFPILDRDERVVFLEGNVFRPGKRQYFEGMTLLDLISSPDDLLPETHFNYGLIERENELTREPEYLAFDLGAALLDGDESQDVALAPRDRVYVFHRAHFRETPSVSIRGEVREPGKYEFRKDMRALDLVLAAGGLTRDAWMYEAELFRTDPATLEVRRISMDLGRVLSADAEHNVVLKDQDELAVHSIWEFKEKQEVEILGEVNNPGNYPLTDGMRVSDLVFAGGNLKEMAYRHDAELTRYEVVDGERRELHHVRIDLGAVVSGSVEANLELRPYDRLLVRRITNWRGDEVVRVEGEVAFPGSYPIEEGERLSRLVERFGGFLDDAYLPAAVFTRSNVRERQSTELERMAGQLEADLARLSVSPAGGTSASDAARRQSALEAGSQLLAELRNARATGRMVINLKDAGDLRGTDFDLVLEDGDRLYVPKMPDYVMVMGQVNNPTAFQYDRGRSVATYVRMAGGKTRFGQTSRTYVIRVDGSVSTRRNTRVRPGDVIVVPESLDRFTGMQFLMDISQVLYQIGIAAASAHTVGVFD